jgi:hypothetical protein
VCSIFLLIASCAGYTYYDQGEEQIQRHNQLQQQSAQLQQLQQRKPPTGLCWSAGAYGSGHAQCGSADSAACIRSFNCIAMMFTQWLCTT